MERIDLDKIIYQKEINIGFFLFSEQQFKDMISKLSQSSFSKKFSLINNFLNFKEYTKVSFEEKKELKNEIDINDKVDDEDILIDEDEKPLLININNCKIDIELDGEYEKFIKEKLDYYIIFNEKKINKKFLAKIYESSKGNYIIITSGYETDEKDITKIYEDFEVTKDKKENNDDDKDYFIFDTFLINLKKKFDMYKIFQKYSIEKSIISFKDYLYNYNKYSENIDEDLLIELFNKFERFSFNNDYADVTIILFQIMAANKNILNTNFTFNVKNLKCDFCYNNINECEYDDNLKMFICYRCRYSKSKYQEEIK
jgi:hypothetical protein